MAFEALLSLQPP